MNARPFEIRKVVLDCGVCGACPAVEINAEHVIIGEDANVVCLTYAQWNDLVLRIEKGELGRLD
jgi:hypothetical protein